MKSKILRSISILAILSVVFIACSSDDDNTDSVDDTSSDISNTELTINDYAQIASGQVTLYDDEGNVLSGLSEGDAFYGQDANYLNGVIDVLHR